MKTTERVAYGLLITAAIFLTSTFISLKAPLNSELVPNFAVTLIIELLLSVMAIYFLRRYLWFHLAIPPFVSSIKPVVYALVATVVINGVVNAITVLCGGKTEMPAALAKLQPWQVIVFLFFYASIAEEVLFRGFLLNFLEPVSDKGITIFKRTITWPVIISALAFSAAHLVLLMTGVSAFFIVRILIFTFGLGVIAGYYQHKYKNLSYALLVHMAGNSLAVVASFVMHHG